MSEEKDISDDKSRRRHHTPEEIEAQKQRVIQLVKTETLEELYAHRNIVLAVLECIKAFSKKSYIMNKEETFVEKELHSMAREQAWKETLLLIDSEIALRETEAIKK